MKSFEPEKVRQFFFIFLLLILFSILFTFLKSFLPSFLGAFTFYILMKKYMKHLVRKKWKTGVAAIFLILISFLAILLPVFILVDTLSSKVGYVISHAPEITRSVVLYLKNIESHLRVHVFNEETVRQYSGLTLQALPMVLGATVNYLVALVIMYILLYFMLTHSTLLELWMEEVLPLRKDNLVRVQHQVNRMVFSNAVGIPLIAILQGTAGFILALVLGLKEPLLWFALTAFTSMLPLVGTALVYVPLAVFTMVNGETTKGIIILVFLLVVIVMIDNGFRVWLQKRIGNVHPLVTLFGVFVGIPLFGFIGIIFGPLLISLFILLMRIYRVEFIATNEELEGE